MTEIIPQAMPVDKRPIFAALAKAQAAMGKAIKDAVNPAFRSGSTGGKYADLASVMDACLPALNANGIAVYQPTGGDESGRWVETILAHESGDTVACRVPLIVGKNDMQGYGSAVTYARRYGLMCMAGIAPEDDDGNAAVAAKPKAERPAEKTPPATQSPLMTVPQGADLCAKITEAGVVEQVILDAFGLVGIADMRQDQFVKAMAKLELTIRKNAPIETADLPY